MDELDEQISYEKTFLIGMKDDDVEGWSIAQQDGYVKGLVYAKMIIENPEENCPRCIEDFDDWTEANGDFIAKGTKVPSECKECGICKECEHLLECSKANS